MADVDDLAALAKTLPKDFFKDLETADFDTLLTPVRFVALHLPIDDALAAGSFLKIYDIRAKLMNNDFGTLAFLEETIWKKVNTKLVEITKQIPNFEIIVFRYEYDFLHAQLFSNGELKEELPPPIAMSSLSDKAEEAILKKVDFFDPNFADEIDDIFLVEELEMIPSDLFKATKYPKTAKAKRIGKKIIYIYDNNLITRENATAFIEFFVQNSQSK